MFAQPADLAICPPALVEIAQSRDGAGARLAHCTDATGRMRIEFLFGRPGDPTTLDGDLPPNAPAILIGGAAEPRSFDQAHGSTAGAADESQAEIIVPEPPPVLAGSSKAWLVTYLDGTRDLVVTLGDPVEDCARLLPADALPRIRMIQRVLGGMLRGIGAASGGETLDARWTGRNGRAMAARPELRGGVPRDGAPGYLRLRRAPIDALGVWEVHWADGEVWLHVCRAAMSGGALAAALGRQFPGAIDFALRRLDLGRVALADPLVPPRWAAIVEPRG
jgi:hypothetical protein